MLIEILKRGARSRWRCGRCGFVRDHVVGEPRTACPGACGATANNAAEEVSGMADDEETIALTGQSDADASAPVFDTIAEARAHREQLIAAGMNRHARRKRARLERAKP